jgi:hypothetical protein
MASRIDIELTSRRDDDTWTWRAAGARQPRGVVDGSLIPAGTQPGAVLRADVDFAVDGIAVVQVHPPRPADGVPSGVERIEIIGSGRPSAGVSVSLAGRRRGERDGTERRRADHDTDPRRSRPMARHDGDADSRPSRRPSAPRPDGAPESRPRRPEGRPRPDGGAAPSATGEDRRRSGDRVRRRFQPSTTYRNQALADLRPEELPVAEQLLRGGIPRVRQAIEEQNARARAEGRDEVSAAPLLAMAEALLPKMNLATWKDRAASARDAGRDTPLRELRSIVAAASTVTLDDEGRQLAANLRQALDERVTALREAWLTRMTKALDDGRVLDALQASARPPGHGARLPADLAVRLAEQASAAMATTTPPEAWLALLDAVVGSPVRRTVRPAGLPAEADGRVLDAARRAAGLVPDLARKLGLPIPPPPGPRRAPASAGRST